MKKSAQFTNSVLMIRPQRFRMNEQTVMNNYFQHRLKDLSPGDIQARAVLEFDEFAGRLSRAGLEAIVVQDTAEPDTPDALFPNNWVSFHADGTVVLYPMFAPNRRWERRHDILDRLQDEHGFQIEKIVDLTVWESEEHYLEGTGSMVFDHDRRRVYAALSQRTHRPVLDAFCEKMNVEPVVFQAYQNVGSERLVVYHTNVVLCIADRYAVLCADCIDDLKERDNVVQSLEDSGREVVFISEEQRDHFAGNALQVADSGGRPMLVLSDAALRSLEPEQRERIERFNPTLSSSLDVIEGAAGGSARCMLAEVFLPRKSYKRPSAPPSQRIEAQPGA